MKITPEVITELLALCEKERNPWIDRAEYGWRLAYVQEPEGELGSGTLKYPTKENRIHAKLLDWRSILLKNKPTFRVQATKPQDMDLSDSVTSVAYKRWKDNGAHFALSNSQLEVGYAGLTILRVNNVEIKPGIYVEQVINVPRGDFWNDPRVLNIGDSWCCYRTWNSIENLQKFFKKQRVDIVVEQSEMLPASEYTEPSQFSPSFTTRTSEGKQKPPLGWGKELIRLLEFWAPPWLTNEKDWKIYYMIQGTDKILHKMDNPYHEVVKEAMPERRELNELTGENIVIPAEPEITVGHGRPPFVSHRCYFKPTENGYLGFYDVEGIAEHLETVQRDLTETRRALMLMARRAAEPPSMEEETSLLEPPKLEPGARNLYRQTKQPPTFIDDGLQSAIPGTVYQINKEVMNELSGIREGMTGEQPRGTSGTPTGTVMFIQEGAFIRMPDIVQQLDKTILDLAKLMLGNMQQNIKEGEFVDVTMGGVQHWVEWTQAHIETDFNIEVVSGMTTILKDIARQQSSTNIFTQVALAVQSQAIGMLKACKQWLLSLDEPAAYGYIPIIDEEIDILEQATQAQAQMAQGIGGMMMPQQEGV